MANDALFRKLGTPITRNKGEHVFEQGDIDKSIYILRAGLLKAYYLTMEGKELIKSFIQPGEFIGSLLSCINNEPGTFYVMCLQDSAILRVPYSALQQAAGRDAETSAFVVNSLTQLAMKKERREYEFLCLSAPERYTLLKQREPELVEQLTQNDIARYLGITPVALSRIKQREC